MAGVQSFVNSATEKTESLTDMNVEPVKIAADPQSECSKVMISELADDPDMAPLVDNFLSKLTPKITNMTEYLSANRLEDLAILAHQLKGAGGGYGFPSISEAAQRVEKQAKTDPDLETIQIAVDELANLCRQAIAGGRRREVIVADTLRVS